MSITQSMETTHSVNQVTVKNITKTIKDRKILEDISFTVSRGQMFAILGPTGSGKSTLLNIITGRLKCDSGSITVDGKPVDRELRRRFGYVLQNDVFFTNLTLWQTLYFTAQIQMPENLSNEEKQAKLNSVINAMNLHKCLHTDESSILSLMNAILNYDTHFLYQHFTPEISTRLIGDLFVRGLSGGEKKRASIACELLTDPAILILDEPTSGLDSSTAWSIVQHLKSETVSKNRIVVSSIHQPSSRIFHTFDKLLLITDGKIGYYGSPQDIQTHFSNLGIHCKPNYNPADFLLELAKADENTIEKITETVSSDVSLCTRKQLGGCRDQSNGSTDVYRKLLDNKDNESKQTTMPKKIIKSSRRWPTSFSQQLRMLTWRGFIQSKGNVLNRYAMAERFTVSMFIALVSFRKGMGYKESHDVIGLIFVTFAYWSFQICTSILFNFPEQRPVIAKERADGTYRLSALYIAKTISELPMILCISIVGFTVNFWISEIGDMAVYLKTLALFVQWAFLWQAFAFFLGSVVKSPRLSSTLFQSYSILSFLTGGFFIQYVPNWLRWLRFSSAHMYAMNGASTIVFSSIHPISCNSTSLTDIFAQSACSNNTVITGDVILQDAGIDLPILYYILPLVASDIVLRLIAYLAMRFRKDTLS